MNKYKYRIITNIAVAAFCGVVGCTKLHQNLKDTLTPNDAANSFSAASFLQTAYTDIGSVYSDLSAGAISPLEDVTGDEQAVPTRKSDWDDNGEWRSLHQHLWLRNDGDNIFLNMWNGLNKIQFDATNVFNFKPNDEQKAEARFVRAFALYQLLDLYGQFPYRNAGENLLNAPIVFRGDSAIQFIIHELDTVTPLLPDLNGGPSMVTATKDAARMLQMKLYLNRGAFLNRAAPTFDNADMQKVISLGNQILANGKFKYAGNYFDTFNPANDTSTETIFAIPSVPGTANVSGKTAGYSGVQNRWWPTLHYNQYNPLKPQAGWNGFSTIADFYASFAVNDKPIQYNSSDTLLLDSRIGGRFYKGSTDKSGITPGFLIGQQYDENKVAEQDRNGNPLIFLKDMAPDLKELDPATLERTGIRVIKYPPDYTNGTVSYNTAGNWLMLYRFPDVILMVAEAKMRQTAPDNGGALLMVNGLRAARGAKPLTTMPLVNTGNVYDPSTLLAERGRELYWEWVRRTDLIRFGMFMKPWAYKNADVDTHYLVFPIPDQALAANPNLIEPPGY
jgi:hypothetical protein